MRHRWTLTEWDGRRQSPGEDRCAIQLNYGRTAAQGQGSGYLGADVFREHTMNQGLVADL